MANIKLLDCTLRDGAYVNASSFGEETIKNIISSLESAGIDIIECGWLKNEEHKIGSSYFHNDKDFKKYINKKNNIVYCLMIDYNRYNVDFLNSNDKSSLDMVRVTFPIDNIEEGLKIGNKIIEKGYKVSFQITNIKSYIIDEEVKKETLYKLILKINQIKPECICIADTFGALFNDEVKIICKVINGYLDKDISIGLHTHNNMQLAFSNTITFLEELKDTNRNIVVDSSLLGMGRGPGNTPTELLINYLNKYFKKNYNIDIIYNIIDKYMMHFTRDYKWGYNSKLGIAGIDCCHVNNIEYFIKKHQITSFKLKKIIDFLDERDRWKYDYNLLENKYSELKLSEENN